MQGDNARCERESATVVHDPEIQLAGGSMSSVVRVGDTVRRTAGRWTPAVHALLRYLEDVGFEGSPRVLGFDDQGREVLTYLPSDASAPWSDVALAGTGRLLRRLHDALAGFVPPADAVWRCPPSARRADSGPIGHNDLCTDNTVYANGVPYGFIDWDMAGPAPPLHDIALTAMNFTPLASGRFQPPGCPPTAKRAARFRVFCDAYGIEDGLALLDAVEEFQRDALLDMLEHGRHGISPYRIFLGNGQDRVVRRNLEWLRDNRHELVRALQRPAS